MQKGEDFETSLITSMDLFPYLDALFTDAEAFAKITDNVKKSHFFMLQRRLAIAFPAVVQHGNKNGVDQVAMTNMYHTKLCSSNGRKPAWLYTKAAKAIGGEKAVVVSKDDALMICKVFALERKTWESLQLRKPEWVEAMVGVIERSKQNVLKKGK